MAKKTQPVSEPAKSKKLGKDGTEGAILSEVAKAALWEKPHTTVTKEVNPGDKIEG